MYRLPPMPNLDVDRLIQGWRGPLIAAFIALIAGLPAVFSLPPLDRDEARFAQASAQMMDRGMRDGMSGNAQMRDGMMMRGDRMRMERRMMMRREMMRRDMMRRDRMRMKRRMMMR